MGQSSNRKAVSPQSRKRARETARHGPRWTDEARLVNSHVLLAEDNLINQKVASGLLGRKGVTVTVVPDGRQASDAVMGNEPDKFGLILMDIDMPVMDGYEATRLIKGDSRFTHIPIVALTAHGSPEDRERCLEAGMSAYLTKPVKPEVLYSTLLELIK